jgi:hypothetical protein
MQFVVNSPAAERKLVLYRARKKVAQNPQKRAAL